MNILHIKQRTRVEGNAVSVCRKIINSMFKFGSFGKDVKFIQPFTENVITTIKLSDTDNVVLVGTDVNLFILLSKFSHPITMLSCVTLELVSDNQYLTISVFYGGRPYIPKVDSPKVRWSEGSINIYYL